MAKIKTYGEMEGMSGESRFVFFDNTTAATNHNRKKTTSNSCCKAKRRKQIEKHHLIEQVETAPHDSSSSESTDISEILTRIKLLKGTAALYPGQKEDYLFERKIIFYAFDKIP